MMTGIVHNQDKTRFVQYSKEGECFLTTLLIDSWAEIPPSNSVALL